MNAVQQTDYEQRRLWNGPAYMRWHSPGLETCPLRFSSNRCEEFPFPPGDRRGSEVRSVHWLRPMLRHCARSPEAGSSSVHRPINDA